MRSPEQPPFISQQCPKGSDDAEKLFQLAVDYHKGRKGVPSDMQKAEKLYEEALELGNAKAAINLGVMYRQDYYNRPNRIERLDYMFALFEKAADMGCPEGIFALAEAYNEGWGVAQSQRKAKQLVEEAAEEGCLNAMVQYGEMLYDEGKTEEGKDWIQKSLKLGNGDAGDSLAYKYIIEMKSEELIMALRMGAKLGSHNCLYHLGSIYRNGEWGQPKDFDYAEKISKLRKSLDDKEYPKIIPNFDELVPLRPVLPFKGVE